VLNEIAPRTKPNRDDADQVPGGSDIQAPFADEVLRLRRTRPFSEPIVSFHALPWGQGRSLAGAGPIGEKYRQLFGEAFLDTEVTYSAGVLDSYFQPSASLDLAQHLRHLRHFDRQPSRLRRPRRYGQTDPRRPHGSPVDPHRRGPVFRVGGLRPGR
jgi:hypothetical protein